MTTPSGPSIRSRRDVALVPCFALAGVAAATGISAVLRGSPDPLLLTGAALLTFLGLILALAIDTPVATRLRSRSATYLAASGLLMTLLTGVALRDDGLSSVYITAAVLIAAHLGLVLDVRVSAAAIVLLEGILVGIHLAEPNASALALASLLAMTAAGWFVGRLGQRAHDAASRHAEVLSRADLLTGTLNRRGLFEVLPQAIDEASAAGRPCSLLVLDLDGFKQVNDERGHQAGDDVLRRVGEVLAASLDEGASAARIGGDEFAVVLPGATQRDADRVGARLAAQLADTVGVSVGVATREPGHDDVDVDALLRRADSELYAIKRNLSVVMAGPTARAPGSGLRREDHTLRARPRSAAGSPVAAPVSYAALKTWSPRTGFTLSGIRNATLTRSGYWVLAAVGALLVLVHAIETGSPTTLDGVVSIGGGLWVATLLLLGWWRSRALLSEGQRRMAIQTWRLPFVETATLLTLGVGLLLLTTDGIIATAVAALFLKVLFDAYVLGARTARPAHAIVVGGWLLVAILGPAEALWAAPFQLALFAASAAVGSVAHAAFDDIAGSSMRLARTDELTGLANRTGLEEDLTRGLRAATRDGHRVALLMLDVDNFKHINDSAGHAAGDALLRQLANALRDLLPDALALGRIGGDEFVVATRLRAGQSAEDLAVRLQQQLVDHAPVSVGHAELPADGYDLAMLLGIADRRSYEAKHRGHHGSPPPPTR